MLKKLVVFALCFMLMLALFACSNSSVPNVASDDAEKDHLVVSIAGDISNLDPNDINNFYSQQVKVQIYETLFKRDKDGKLIGCLAESWEYEDDCTIVINIRQGVKFHNGDELKASDVLFSLKRASELPLTLISTKYIDFDKTTVLDDYTLKLVTKEPYMPQLAQLEWPLCAISSEKSFKESNGDYNNAPIGTGPYKVVDWITGDRIELTAFEDYWDKGKPYIKKLTMRIITESSNRAIELETGGVDIIYEVNPSDINRFQGNPEIKLVRDLSQNTRFLHFNTARPPFDNKLLREAVAYAIDVESAVKIAWAGSGLVAKGYMNPYIDGFHDQLTMRPYDPEKAKELLVRAGYPNGFSTMILTDTTQNNISMAEIFQAQLAEVGISVEVISEEMGTFQKDIYGNYDMLIYGFTATTGEADKALRRWHKDANEFKMFGWYHEEYSQLIDDAAKTLDETTRNNMYKQAQQILFDECVNVPCLHKEIVSAHRSYVKGFNNNTTYESHMLKDVYFEF